MPRRNKNADYCRYRGYQPIGDKSLNISNAPQSGSGVPNGTIKPPQYDVVTEGYDPDKVRISGLNLTLKSEICIPKHSILKITGESIMREFRRENRNKVGAYCDTPVLISNQSSVKPTPTFQPYRVIPQPHPSFIRRFLNRINWNIALEWACWAAVVGCLVYIVTFVITPFGFKIVWK